MGSIESVNYYSAIHNFQQVSWEGITEQEKRILSRYVDNQPNATESLQRGMVVSQDTIDIQSNKSKVLKYLKDNNQTQAYAQDTIDNYNGEIIVFDNKMIGRILVGDKRDKGFITDFIIDKEYRGNKLGSKLLDDAINKYGGYDLLVDKDNKLAIDMYRKRGFETTKTYKNQYYMVLKNKINESYIEESVRFIDLKYLKDNNQTQAYAQDTIDNWVKKGEVTLNSMNSWSTDSGQAFADVPRQIDAENGQRSVILISENGLPMSAALPRTNSYDEKEVLSKVSKLDIVDVQVRENPYRTATGYRSFSPTITIIKVRPRKKGN